MHQLKRDIKIMQEAIDHPAISIKHKKLIQPSLEKAKTLWLDHEICSELDSFNMYNISQLRNYTVMRARIIEDVKRRISSGKLTIKEALVEIEWVFIENEG
jgi:hypothetical protein